MTILARIEGLTTPAHITATLTSPTAVGVDSITATLNGFALAASTTVTFTPAPASQLSHATGSLAQTAGVPFTVDVIALDQYGNTDTGYSGTAAFSSSDGAATLPAATALTAGHASVSVTLTQKTTAVEERYSLAD